MAEKLLKTVFDWEHFAIYLSGPIDMADDGGNNWRDDWAERLINIGVKPSQIYNPCRKPIDGTLFNLNEEAKLTKELRRKKDWDGLHDLMGQIVHVDLRLLDLSSVILVNFPKIGQDKFVQNILDEKLKFEHLLNFELSNLIDQCIDKYSNMRIPTYGTIHEIVQASQQRKPIFVVWEGEGKKGCSSWIMRLVGHENVFASVGEMISHLDSISHGKAAFNAREWLLLKPNR